MNSPRYNRGSNDLGRLYNRETVEYYKNKAINIQPLCGCANKTTATSDCILGYSYLILLGFFTIKQDNTKRQFNPNIFHQIQLHAHLTIQ